MKTIVINAGPKRKDNNAELAKSALNGAESSGADVEYVDLYKLELSGCRICFICKKEGMQGKCYWRDDTSPLIERILSSDCLIISVPIFFTEPTSHYRALMERLIYCLVSYQSGNTFKGKVNVGLFYTINYSKDYFEKSVRPNLKYSEDLFKMLNGKVEIHSFRNITKRESSHENDELEEMENQFNLDLKKAYDIGLKLSENGDG